MINTSTDITLNVAPHPFTVEHTTHKVSAGGSVASMLAHIQPDPLLRRYAHVFLDGHALASCDWARVYPKAGTTVTVRMVPQGGGGGKNPLRTLLSIAVLAASPVIATSLAGALGATGTVLGISTARLVTGGINLLGRLAVNALAPPPRPRYNMGQKEAPVYSIHGAQNRVETFARVPKVLGRHRFVPPLGAMPYTETLGGDQYLRMLFIWGYGPLEVSDLRIGETPLAEFEGVEIETRQGYQDDAPLALYSNAVLQNDLQVVLRETAGYVVRTSEADAEELSVDITFPRGLFKFSGSNKVSTSVEVEVQYAPAGTGSWSTGAREFRTVAAATLTLSDPPQGYVSGGVNYITSRIDRIVFDPAAATVKVIEGDIHRAGLDSGFVALPPVPAGYVGLAYVSRRSDRSGIIMDAEITDERATARPGVIYESGDDFAVSAGLAANQVNIAAGGVKYSPLMISAKQATTLRRAVSFKVPKGQYDVRLRRLTIDASDDNVFDECMWTALRTVRSSAPVKMRGLAMTAIRIKATDQLNGIVDRFNGVVQALIADYTGDAWVVQPTSNPASIYRHILQGAGNNRPLGDHRIDVQKIEAWHARCREGGYAYDAVINYDTSIREVLQDVAALGRASPAIVDGKWSVVEDIAQSVPVQHFTPRNSFAFEAHKVFDEQPQALRVRFINRDKGWNADERLVFADGVSEQTASHYETLELAGVTSSDQAWKQGRYHLATALLRPETYQFNTDIEHLVCTRGDLIRLTHDVPMFGLASARVSMLSYTEDGKVSALTLDAVVTQEAGKSYSLRCRTKSGDSRLLSVRTVVGDSAVVELAVALGVESAPHVGDLAMFGESGQESVALIVKSIEPQGDLSARLTCVDAAPEIYQADQGAIPPFRSNITLSGSAYLPPAPDIAEVQSGEESLIRHADGSLTTRIVITLVPPVYSHPLTTQVLIRGEGEQKFVPADILSETPTQISLVGVEEGQRYDIQLRYLAANNNRSVPRILSSYQVAGTSALPSDVGGFDMSVVGDVAYLRWNTVPDLDLSHYCIRHCMQTVNAEWSAALDIAAVVPMDATTVALPALPGSYLIKAIDVGGRASAQAAVVRSPMGVLQGYNAVLSIDESAGGYLGEKTHLARIDGALRLDGADEMDIIADIDAIVSIDTGTSGLRETGHYAFSAIHDLGDIYTSRVSAALSVRGLDMSTSVDQWVDVDAGESWDSTVDPASWSVQLQVSTTLDAPNSAAEWTAWSALTLGDYTARAFRFRLLLKGSNTTITPVVEGVSVAIDMPDRYESKGDIEVSASGETVSFSCPFRGVPVIQVTPHNLESGDYYKLDAVNEAGFDLRFFDAAGNGIDRRFDYVAKGYGRLQI